MREETGLEVRVGRQLCIAENFFTYRATCTFHEILMCFEMSTPSSAAVVDQRFEGSNGSAVLSAVDGQDNDVVAGDAEVDSVRKPVQNRTPRFGSHQPKLQRVVGDAFDRFVQRCAEHGAKPRPPTFVAISCFEDFGLSASGRN